MTTATISPHPEQGQMVSVRSRNWIVTDVSASTLPPERLQMESPQHLLTLSSVEDDGLGEELNVIWELEPGARVVEKVALPEPTGFDPPDRLDAFLDAVRWGASSSADVRNIQAPFRAGIDIEDYSMPGVVQADTKVEPVRKMLKFERDLAKQINELLEQYRETQRELRLSPDNIRKVVEVGLALAEQPALVPIKHESGKPVFTLPALKHSWAACAEGLEHPHTKDIRPITFDHSAADGRDDIVLVHLNHRLVQMSLRLLRAEVWSVKGRKRLHRITARLVPNHVLNAPAVVAHARLVVIGGDSHRLHEEIITAGGMLKEGRFSRLNLGELEKILAAATNDEAYQPIQKHLLELWDKFAPALAQSLEARMNDRTSGLQKKLGERAEKEAEDIRAILLELKKAIDTELNDPEYQQLLLFDDLEKDQFERNKDFLRDRSKAIPAEIERETAAIKSRYADPQPRMFPVAVTLLVPERLRKG